MRHSLEVALGRGAACCVHPLAAWRVRPAAVRWAIAGAYTVAAYVVVLLCLVAL